MRLRLAHAMRAAAEDEAPDCRARAPRSVAARRPSCTSTGTLARLGALRLERAATPRARCRRRARAPRSSRCVPGSASTWPELPGMVRGGSSVYAGYSSVRSMSPTIGSDDGRRRRVRRRQRRPAARDSPPGHASANAAQRHARERQRPAARSRRMRHEARADRSRPAARPRARDAPAPAPARAADRRRACGSSRSSSIADHRSSPTPRHAGSPPRSARPHRRAASAPPRAPRARRPRRARRRRAAERAAASPPRARAPRRRAAPRGRRARCRRRRRHRATPAPRAAVRRTAPHESSNHYAGIGGWRGSLLTSFILSRKKSKNEVAV